MREREKEENERERKRVRNKLKTKGWEKDKICQFNFNDFVLLTRAKVFTIEGERKIDREGMRESE